MLIWHYIVLIFRVERLVVWGDIYLIIWQLVLTEVFKKVCVPRPVEVHVSVVGVSRLEEEVSMLYAWCKDVLPFCL
jgi:hypothetical protein